LLEFSSVVDAVECAVAVQAVMAERNEGVPVDHQMLFRIGINLGDILIEGDDILGDGVNIAARLEGIAEPGGICISSSAYEQVRGKVEVEFADLGEQKLKNIARPVRAFVVVREEVGLGAVTKDASPMRSAAPRLSIVVLPFTNMGGGPEEEYFVDGITESLTTDLSRINGSFVIARNTAFTFKGRAVDAKRVGRELNVRYVLEGSVQRGGNRLRVNVQLIDAETGNHIWAERFNKPLADLFETQDEIVSRLANALDAQLVAAEARRAEGSLRPDAMDLYFRGRAYWNKGLTREYLTQSRSFFERALTLDPSNVDAMVGLASVDAVFASSSMTDDAAGHFAIAEATLTKALSLDPNHAIAHMVLALVLMFTNRATQGISECEHALALDRNLANAHGLIGNAKYLSGRPAETEAHILEALRLSPRDTFSHQWMVWLGLSKVYLNADSEAVTWFRRGLEANRNNAIAYFHLASALVRLGSLDEARTAARTGLALDAGFSIRRLKSATWTDNPAFLAQRERIYEGMRLAGVPQ
jgi:TolB-like protein